MFVLGRPKSSPKSAVNGELSSRSHRTVALSPQLVWGVWCSTGGDLVKRDSRASFSEALCGPEVQLAVRSQREYLQRLWLYKGEYHFWLNSEAVRTLIGDNFVFVASSFKPCDFFYICFCPKTSSLCSSSGFSWGKQNSMSPPCGGKAELTIPLGWLTPCITKSSFKAHLLVFHIFYILTFGD